MKDNSNIDKLIRSKLENLSVEPSPHVWQNIKGQMAAQKKKKRLAYAGWISAAAVVLFAFWAGWYFNEELDKGTPPLAEQEITKEDKDIATPQLKITKTTQEPAKELTQEQNNGPLLARAVQEERHTQNRKIENPIAPELLKRNKLKDNVFVVAVEHLNYTLLARLEAILELPNYDLALSSMKKDENTDLALFPSDKALIASNAQQLKQNKNIGEKGWIVGAHVSPGYSSQRVSHSDKYAERMTYTGNKGNRNTGGGISIQYKTSKRLRVESGLYYSQNGQSSKNSSKGLFSLRNYDESSYLSIEKSQPVFTNTVQVGADGISMNSTAGVVKLESAPQGALFASNAEVADARYANTLTADGNFSQLFEFVELPLYLRYSILDKKLGVEILGGINAGIVVGNSAYINNEFGKQNIGFTANISKINISSTVGIGVNYLLGKHFSLAVEPRLNYYLKSINTRPDVDYQPYRLALYTGIYYEF